MSAPVAFAGTGNMGGAMAARLLSLGWPVRVRDIDAAKVDALAALGAKVAHSAAEAARGCRLLVLGVVDAAQVDEVLFGFEGASQALAAGDTVMLCPTISPETVESVQRRLQALGVATIDAPMSGGPARARDGSMSLMVACADAVFARHEAVLRALSNKVFRVGERCGDGARTKLVNNLLAGINLAGAAEVMALAGHLGLDLARTLDVIEQSSGQSWIGSDRMRRAIAGDFEPRAHVTLLAKDTRLAIEAAARAGAAAPLGVLARDTFARAVEAGLDSEDDAALFKLVRGH